MNQTLSYSLRLTSNLSPRWPRIHLKSKHNSKSTLTHGLRVINNIHSSLISHINLNLIRVIKNIHSSYVNISFVKIYSHIVFSTTSIPSPTNYILVSVIIIYMLHTKNSFQQDSTSLLYSSSNNSSIRINAANQTWPQHKIYS
jgi:hypothetical protein